MDPTLIAVALIAVVGSSLPSVMTGLVNRRAARRAEEAAARAQAAATEAQLGIVAAQADAAKAQTAAAEAAAELVRAARVTGRQLDALTVGQGALSKQGKEIHTLVNSARTTLLQERAALWLRIAAQNPLDEDAQRNSAIATREAQEAQLSQDEGAIEGP